MLNRTYSKIEFSCDDEANVDARLRADTMSTEGDASAAVNGHVEGERRIVVMRPAASTVRVHIDCRKSAAIGLQLIKLRDNVQVRCDPKRRTLAYNAGVRAYDVILAIECNGTTFSELHDMRAALVNAVQGRTTITLLLQRSTANAVNQSARTFQAVEQTDVSEHDDAMSVDDENGCDFDNAPGPSNETSREKRKRLRAELTSPNYKERQRDRKKVVNMTPEKIDTQRTRDRVVNMTPKQIDTQRTRHRVITMTPEQIDSQRVRAGNARRRRPLLNSARGEMADAGTDRHVLNRMITMCSDCHAKHWLEEKVAYSSIRLPKFSMCCGAGKVSLPTLNKLPPQLHNLLTGGGPECVQFRHKIRAYNSILAFTSVGVKLDEHLASGRQGAFAFQIQGEMSHRMGTLEPPSDGQRPQFAQLYIYDTDHELNNRMHVFPDLNEATLRTVQNMLHKCNPYVRVFRQAISVVRDNQRKNQSHVFFGSLYTAVSVKNGIEGGELYNATQKKVCFGSRG